MDKDGFETNEDDGKGKVRSCKNLKGFKADTRRYYRNGSKAWHILVYARLDFKVAGIRH